RLGKWLPKSHRGWRRLIPEIVFLANLACLGAPRGWRPDVVFTACPMLAQIAWLRLNVWGSNVPSLVVVQDSMAHAATELGIIRNRYLGSLLKRFEAWALAGGTLHCTISESMRVRVEQIIGKGRKCVVIPNWIHSSLHELAGSDETACSKRQSNRLFYSGNFGVKQGLPQFLRTLDEARVG